MPDRRILEVRMAEDNEGPKQRFGAEAYDDGRLALAKAGIAGRLREDFPNWVTAEDLLRFGRKEGNNLMVAAPKVILVENAAAEAEELYRRLVHVDPVRRKRLPAPNLAALFETRLAGVPLLKDYKVEIPDYGSLKVPYAYQNGALNLIQPEAFSKKSAEEKGNELAVTGHLIQKRSDAAGAPKRLIVVGGFDPAAPEELKRRIELILREHDTRLVREEKLDEFVEEIRREAHE